MSTKRSLPKINPEILAKMEISKDDLLVIAVAKHEENLEIERRKVDADLKTLNEQVASSQKGISAIDPYHG